MDKRNTPLIERDKFIKNKSYGKIIIPKNIILKIFSQIPEDASISTMAYNLIGEYLSFDSDVVQTYNSFTGTTEYKTEQTFIALMAQNENYSSLPGYDHEIYQGDYQSKADIINSKLLYKISFKSSIENSFAGFEPISKNVIFDKAQYVLNVNSFPRFYYTPFGQSTIKPKLSVDKIIMNSTDDPVEVGKFNFSNRINFFRENTNQSISEFLISAGEKNINLFTDPSFDKLKGKEYYIQDVDNTLLNP